MVEPQRGQDRRAPPTSLQPPHTRWEWSHPYRGGPGGVCPHTTQTRNEELGPDNSEGLDGALLVLIGTKDSEWALGLKSTAKSSLLREAKDCERVLLLD